MNLEEYLNKNYKLMLKKPFGDFKYSSILPVDVYASQLWDWGSWLSDIAIRQIATNLNKEEDIFEYEIGCIYNFLSFQNKDGSIPIVIAAYQDKDLMKAYPYAKNIHKPVLAQHVAFIAKYNKKDLKWLKPIYPKLKKFIKYYENNAKHSSGLFYFFDDFAIGVDNEISCFYRPDNSCASIYLNSLIYKELEAMEYLASVLQLDSDYRKYKEKKSLLKKAINKHCYDEKDGMYYSCDINLRKIDSNVLLHSNAPRHYDTLIMRLGSWTSFMPLWAGIANKKQAVRIVKENLIDKKAFWAPYGVRTLSKYEKMYRPCFESSNPSNWHGGIWGVSNYFVFRGLIKYGFNSEATELIDKTVSLFEKDFKANKCLHEYYDPESGKAIHNPGFLSWNMLVMNMVSYKKKLKIIFEF